MFLTLSYLCRFSFGHGNVTIWIAGTKNNSRLFEAEIAMTEELTVQVWGEPYLVSLEQKSKTLWIAAGNYRRRRIEVQATGRSAAIEQWQNAARYKLMGDTGPDVSVQTLRA